MVPLRSVTCVTVPLVTVSMVCIISDFSSSVISTPEGMLASEWRFSLSFSVILRSVFSKASLKFWAVSAMLSRSCAAEAMTSSATSSSAVFALRLSNVSDSDSVEKMVLASGADTVVMMFSPMDISYLLRCWFCVVGACLLVCCQRR